MTYSAKTKIIALIAVITILASIAGYFWYFQKPAGEPAAPATVENPPIEKKSLADDENYIKERVEYFLANNPSGTSEEYSQDIVFHDIAVKEKDAKICDKVKDSYWKEHCYRLLK